MQIHDLIVSMNQASREIAAQRWGIPPSTPRVMAENLKKFKAAQRTAKRGMEVAPGLVRELVESAGTPVQRTPEFELEARKLDGWFPLISTPGSWALPQDLAYVMSRTAERERFHLLSMLGRLTTDGLRELLRELGLKPLGSINYQAIRLASVIFARPRLPEVQAAAALLGELQVAAVKDISSLDHVTGSGGQLFDLRMADGRQLRITCRELAAECGVAFSQVDAPPGQAVSESGERRTGPALPEIMSIGAIVAFAHVRAADEAMKVEEFRAIVLRRLDDRRVVTRSEYHARETLAMLEALGFPQDDHA